MRQSGYSYPVLLVALLVLGIFSQVARVEVSYANQRDREEELLFRGRAYQAAIASYFRTWGHYPRGLEELKLDGALPPNRHIRTLYGDPMDQGGEGWQILRSPAGGIQGVASRSEKKPLKQEGFPLELSFFARAASYQDWVFAHQGSSEERKRALTKIR